MLIIRLLALAAQGVLRRRIRSIITLISVAIGTAGILLFLGIANDLQDQLQQQLGNYEPATILHVSPPFQADSTNANSPPPAGIDNAVLAKLKALPDVRDAFVEVQVGGNGQIGALASPLELRPAPPAYLEGGASVNVIAGRLYTDDTAHELVVTVGFAQSLSHPPVLAKNQPGQPGPGQAAPGQGAPGQGGPDQTTQDQPTPTEAATPTVGPAPTAVPPVPPASLVGKTVVFTPQNLDGSNGTPVNFTIVGVIDGRSPFAYVPYTVGVAMAPPDPNAPQGNYDAAVVEAISVDKVAGVRKAVEALQLHVDTPESVSSSLAGALNTARFIAALVAGIALALAVINITNTLLSAVAERIREIGIMKAIGARNWHIGALFLLESLLLGLTGGLVGGTLAWLMTLTLSNLVPIQLPDSPPITLSLPYATVLVATLAVTVVSGIAGLLPAMRAARTDPVAAITFNH